jgi:hypothetical protein
MRGRNLRLNVGLMQGMPAGDAVREGENCVSEFDEDTALAVAARNQRQRQECPLYTATIGTCQRYYALWRRLHRPRRSRLH